jgi:hypothetical protein
MTINHPAGHARQLKTDWLIKKMKITKLRHAAAEIGLRQFARAMVAAGFMMRVSDLANPADAGFADSN